jgi:ferredoxin
MNKQYISYGLIGIIAGLVLGFFVGNMGAQGGGASVANSNRAIESVNPSNTSPGGNQQLPANHPPITPGQTTPAPPLTEDQMKSQPNAPSAQADQSMPPSADTSLPLIDPLPASSSEKRVEQERKNIQVLKGLPADRLMPVMKAFSAALGVNCTYCHVSIEQPEKDDKPTKQRARDMIKMMRDVNTRLGGGQKVSCMTCHRGQPRPPQ